MTQNANGAIPHQWMNLYPITNQAAIAIEYRLLSIRGIPAGDSYDKNVNQLVKRVAYEIKEPVALIRDGEHHCLAIPSTAALPSREQRLMPHVATLDPADDTHTVDLAHLTDDTVGVAVAFLQRALSTPLWTRHDLWENGRSFYQKRPLNGGGPRAAVDIYPGFTWSVLVAEDHQLFLSLDTTVRYIEGDWLSSEEVATNPQRYQFQRCLYHYGNQWYIVQFMGLTGMSVAEQRFPLQTGDEITDVYTYTRDRWRANPPPWIRTLSPESPAIIYRMPGSEQERHGALSLCKRALSTADAGAAGLHRHSIMDPARRIEHATRAVSQYFQHAQLVGQSVDVSTVPLEVPRTIFPVPAQRFGQDRILATQGNARDVGYAVVPPDQLAQRRLRLLFDPQTELLTTSPFDAQFLFLPLSMPRAINEDFEQRFTRAMRELTGQQTYALQRVLYDDRQATSLYRQIRALDQSVTAAGIRRGYALLVLPPRAASDLHHHSKRKFWPDLQFQCATAEKIRSFYGPGHNGEGYRPLPDQQHKLTSYVRNCALSMLVVNRKWPWALETSLHMDVHIGIDVLNGMAGVTFVYGNGRHILFQDYRCKQQERLTAAQVRSILVERLRQDLPALHISPRSILIHRDGRTFGSELTGLQAAVRDLKQEGLLPLDSQVGVVDIRKTTSNHLRLVEGSTLESAHNPMIGSYQVLTAHEGIVCTTGLPFRFPGTANPLAIVVREGDLDIRDILEDLFALSQLAFTAPDKCMRLPITIKLADDFLEPIASRIDEEEALYESDALDEVALVGSLAPLQAVAQLLDDD